jgi:hypothetical protein
MRSTPTQLAPVRTKSQSTEDGSASAAIWLTSSCVKDLQPAPIRRSADRNMMRRPVWTLEGEVDGEWHRLWCHSLVRDRRECGRARRQL